VAFVDCGRELVHITHGPEHPTRAALGFLVLRRFGVHSSCAFPIPGAQQIRGQQRHDVALRAARRNSQADPTHSMAKTALRINTAITPGAKSALQKISAITGTNI
jgi:hypothetical protein